MNFRTHSPLLVAGILAGCASRPDATLSSAPQGGDTSPGVDMVTRGKQLYASNCASCHGDAGQGTEGAPPVVGAQALPLRPRVGQDRDVPFRTALDVYAWAREHMPPADPDRVSDEDMLAIMAFALSANGIELKGGTLDGDRARAIVLHE